MVVRVRDYKDVEFKLAVIFAWFSDDIDSADSDSDDIDNDSSYRDNSPRD